MISKVASKSSSSRSSAPKTSRSNSLKSYTRPGSSKSPARSSTVTRTEAREKFQASAELKQSHEADKAKPGSADPAQKSDPSKGPQDANKTLEDKLCDLQKQLEEIKAKSEADAAKSADKKQCKGGGCPGGGGGCDKGGAPEAPPAEAPKEAKPADGKPPQDPNQELTNMAIGVLAGQQVPPPGGSAPAGSPPAPAGAAPIGAGPGAPPVPGAPPAPGAAGAPNPKANLLQRAQQLKGQGFQPKPETRQLVQIALGSDPFAAAPAPGQLKAA